MSDTTALELGDAMRDLLADVAGELGGAAEGSEEEARLAKIGALLHAWDDFRAGCKVAV